MELIYLYLGNINRPLKNQGLHFGSKFRASYDPETRELTIEDQPNAKPCIYGNRIKSLDLLVGQNGTGKSTILDLLGLPYQSRFQFLPLSDDEDDDTNGGRDTWWFALYHLRDSMFAVEGYCADKLRILANIGTLWKPFYSAAFCYDIRKQCASNVQFLQDVFDNERERRRFYDKLFFVRYEPERSACWYDNPYQAPELDVSVDTSFQRICTGHNGYAGIIRYLYDSVHNHEFASKMGSKPGTEIKIEIHLTDKSDFAQLAGENISSDLDRSSAGRKIAETLLYCGQKIPLAESLRGFLPPFSRGKKIGYLKFTDKEKMVLLYLEELACHIISQNGFKPIPYRGENTYDQRKQHLLNVLEWKEQTDYRIAREIVAGIEAIPDCYFKDGAKAVIPLHEMPRENFLMELAQGLDRSLLGEHEINHRHFVRMSFVGISTGEAQYLDLYATLYHAIKSAKPAGHSAGDTCVLLLDEPDCRFHPEWSRNFILNLTELLNTDVFRNYNYQVIITTHSPFLVSDVPKESIHCLRRDKDGSISIQASPYGLLSNLNDLITDSFFAESIFGAFAEQYANKLIEDIRAIELQRNSVTRNQLTELHDRLDRIEDSMVRESLNRRLYRLEARAR